MSTSTADRTREAWARYAERLQGLEGPEYDEAESVAWDELQETLRGLEPLPAVAGAGVAEG